MAIHGSGKMPMANKTKVAQSISSENASFDTVAFSGAGCQKLATIFAITNKPRMLERTKLMIKYHKDEAMAD